MSLANEIEKALQSQKECFSLDLIYELFPEQKRTTLRGRINRELIGRGILKRITKGIYVVTKNDRSGVVIEGDARKLDMLEDESIDLVVADHPYQIAQGTNRSFNSHYKDSTFEYSKEDLEEKVRVLKDGGFLVEFMPEMKEGNWEYHFKLLNLAKEAGLKLYTKVSWYKAEIRDGQLIDHSAFVGRKAVMEDIYIFTKGAPRKLRERKQGDELRLERGASAMLPAVIKERPLMPKERAHKAQKPLALLTRIVELFSKASEVVLDQFSGSFSLFDACLQTQRIPVSIEMDSGLVQRKLNLLKGN